MKKLIILAAVTLGIAGLVPNADARTVYRADRDGDRVVVIKEGRGSDYHVHDNGRSRTYRSERYDRRDHHHDRDDRRRRDSVSPRHIVRDVLTGRH